MPALKSATKKNTAKRKPLRGPLAPDRVAAILKALDEAYPDAVCALNAPLAVGAAGCDDSLCAVHGRARQHGYAGTLPPLPYSASDGQGDIAATRRAHPHAPASSATKQIDSGRGAQDHLATSTARCRKPLPSSSPSPARRARRPTWCLAFVLEKPKASLSIRTFFALRDGWNWPKRETAEKVEQELMQVLPRGRWIGFSHQIIHHGRQVCIARNPKCDRCNLEQLCRSKDKTWES